jgi:hypothetical protein
MKCWNSAFNAQGSRVICRSRTCRSSENIYVGSSSSGGAQEKGERGNENSVVYNQNWWKNLFGSQLFSFCKNHFHSQQQLCVWCPIMPKLAILAFLITWLLQITLLHEVKSFHFTSHLWRRGCLSLKIIK